MKLKKKSKLGKKNDWAKATKKARAEMVRKGVIEKDEMVLFNVGTKGKMLYELAKKYNCHYLLLIQLLQMH